MNDITEPSEELAQLRRAVERLANLQMATMRQLAAVQAELQAVSVIATVALEGGKFEEGEATTMLSDSYAKLRRAHVQRCNDFLLNRGFISELPADDPRWDEAPAG